MAAPRKLSVAYFSMEVGLEPSVPTYSGGLGILAGDTIRAAADLGVAMAAVTLVHRKGYFKQTLDEWGGQGEAPDVWSPQNQLECLPQRAVVKIQGRTVLLRSWLTMVRGHGGHEVPVYFLDTALEENTPFDQSLTDHLYGGDQHYRLCQEVVLGLGGVAMLRALGFEDIQTYHMNEGHSAFLSLALLGEQRGKPGGPGGHDSPRERVRKRCVFTTHTPVAAGHDQFPMELVRTVLDPEALGMLSDEACANGTLNMSYLALCFSHYVNGVAMRHGEISQGMFPNYPVNSITNGVHALTWTSRPFRKLYDRHHPEWRRDNLYLRYAIGIPLAEIQQAHAEAKRLLLGEIERRAGVFLKEDVLTIGFARRATAYKRPYLVFSDLERLRRLAREVGPIQVVCAGKAHPQDEPGKALIRHIFEAKRVLADAVRVIYLTGYDWTLAHFLCAGADVWLNTPQKPHEASGTSGMKAALNGVPSLSILDGWWIEGHIEGVTGWCIDEEPESPSDTAAEIDALYRKLEQKIVPMFYGQPSRFATVMRSTIALNGSFFNAQRMVGQYLQNAYAPTVPGETT